MEALEELSQLFFALDHARWMPVHIRDMKHMPETIMNEFDVIPFKDLYLIKLSAMSF